ncbi:MFS transporter [Kitasatospora cheerisanensis]|uniref:MFS transporter n=1 Tax=Kitasatospora cheerisanensis TaxID=81942 RepID=UPI000561DDC6|nr:MFS transporter [Kitasatospora cheerisanensis]
MKRFRLLVAGNAVSAYGSYLNMVALNVFVYHLTGSALTAGLYMAVRLLTSVASGVLAGALASRIPRKRLMVGADLTQATALVLLLLAPSGARVALLFGLAVVAGACSTVSGVSLRSAVPEIVGADLRTRANSLLATGRSLAMVAGFGSASVIVAQLGYRWAFALDALTFLVSASVLLSLPIRTEAAPAGDSPAPAAEAEAKGKAEAKAKADDGGGRWATVVLLRSMPVVAVMVLVRAVDGLGSSSHNVALPIYSDALDHAHPAAFISQFWATWAIGNIAVQQILSRWTSRTGRSPGERVFALGACAMSAAFILVFAGLPTALAVVVALLAGMADGLTEVAYVSRLQTVPDAQRARLFGLSASVENLGFGLGMILSGALLEHFSPLRVVGGFHGLAIVLCLGFLLLLVRGAATRRAAPTPADDRLPASEGERV